MKFSALFVAAVISASGLLMHSCPKAQAVDYGAFVLRNPTTATIYYQVRWGNGEWTSHCADPFHSISHYSELDCDGTAPQPCVRFDCVAGDDAITNKVYDVQMLATDCPADGKLYFFRYSACGRFLDLYQSQ